MRLFQTMQTQQSTPPFTHEALEILFEKSNFKLFQKTGYMSHYWAPLISVCSGTRRNEIFFLTPDDIFQKYGIWIFQINARCSINLKSESAPRTIPVHPLLKKLRFLDFVQERRRTHPSERLFSEYKAIQENAGVLFSRSFTNWIKATVTQLPDEKKSLFKDDFHFPSLRALFSAEMIRSKKSDAQDACNGFIHAPDNDKEQCDLKHAAHKIQKMEIESYFPILYTFEQLML